MKALGVYAPEDCPQLNGILGLSPALAAAIKNEIGTRASNVVSRLDHPTPINPNALVQSRYSAAKKVLEFLNQGNILQDFKGYLERLEFGIISLQIPPMKLMNFSINKLNAALPDYPILRYEFSLLPQMCKKILVDFVQLLSPDEATTRIYNLANTAGANLKTNMFALVNIINGANMAKPSDTNRFAGITARSFSALRILNTLHRPHEKFPGFLKWGPGDHGVHNVKYHFLKHVCYTASDHDDPDECAWWWKTLGITLTRVQMTAFFAPSTSARDRAALLSFFDTNGNLIQSKTAKFLANGGVSNHPECINHMIATYQNTYEQYAIQQSKNMKNIVVQSNGTEVYVSGGIPDTNLQSGVFIIGRIDAGLLGISSCYHCNNLASKQSGAIANKVWDLC